MFEAAELGHSIEDAVFHRRSRVVRADLLDAQYDIIQKKNAAVVILVNGVDGAGKGETVNVLNEWMDTRFISNHAFQAPTVDELARPPMWRYWQVLPPKGRVGIFLGNWYNDALRDRVARKIDGSELDTRVGVIQRFEKMLVDEGVLLLKYWFHLSQDQQREQLHALEKNKATRWKVTAESWRRQREYPRYVKYAEKVLRQTSTGEAPWTIVEGADANYRTLAVTESVLAALKARSEAPPKQARTVVAPVLTALDGKHVLDQLKFDKRLSKEKYEKILPKHQGKIAVLTRSKPFADKSAVVVFEGCDAGGKGGAIRRLTQALDARDYRVIPIAAPTEEERARPYLWRFWRQLPPRRHFTMYDRSWYGRVLVERVEKFASEAEWMRAYAEINDFEYQLHRAGIAVMKFWLAVSKDEQLRRFKEREKTRFKRFKITDEDWRNRKKWDDYQVAASDMIERTSTSYAPWHVIDANDKHYARITILDTVRKSLRDELDR